MIKIKLSTESKLNHLNALCRAFRGVCSTVIKEDVLLYQLELCLNEAVTNVIKHAYNQEPMHTIDVIIQLEEHEVSIQVLDQGLRNTKPHIKNELEYNVTNISSLPESGWGCYLINEIMDKVIFTNQENTNVIEMVKNFKSV